MTTELQARDAMQFVNDQDAATLERFAERLEFRATDPTFVAYRLLVWGGLRRRRVSARQTC